jgi:hypothetical protein
MAEVTNPQEPNEQARQGQDPERIRSEGGCCLPMFPECGPDTCGLPLTDGGGQEPTGNQPLFRTKVVKLKQSCSTIVLPMREPLRGRRDRP